MEPSESSESIAARDADQFARQGRVWQHALHEDQMLFQRGNLFLVAESLLVVAYATMLPTSHTGAGEILAARVIATFGLLLTVMWLYVGHRHLRYCMLIRMRMLEMLPEYRETRARWRSSRISSLPLITYFLPSLAIVMWVFLLVIPTT
jgi:hypothetical protein